MLDCKFLVTPMVAKSKPSKNSRLFCDPAFYRSIVGSLQYLTFTRPDICFAVNFVFQYMQEPIDYHFNLVKHMLRYIKGTLDHGHCITATSKNVLTGFSDADWAGYNITRRSTTGYSTFLGNTAISWSAKKQSTISHSSCEAEYRAMAATTAEMTWLRSLLNDLQIQLESIPVLYCDNVSALNISVNPLFHSKSKHIAIDYHYVRE